MLFSSSLGTHVAAITANGVHARMVAWHACMHVAAQASLYACMQQHLSTNMWGAQPDTTHVSEALHLVLQASTQCTVARCMCSFAVHRAHTNTCTSLIASSCHASLPLPPSLQPTHLGSPIPHTSSHVCCVRSGVETSSGSDEKSDQAFGPLLP